MLNNYDVLYIVRCLGLFLLLILKTKLPFINFKN